MCLSQTLATLSGYWLLRGLGARVDPLTTENLWRKYFSDKVEWISKNL